MKTLRYIISLISSVLKKEPIHRWRRLDNGKYICDGDCGRWSMHGVCTCGLCHHFKYFGDGSRFTKIERDTVSWRREGDTETHMRRIPRREKCDHGVHLNIKCLECEKMWESFNTEFFKKCNENTTTTL